MHEFLTISGSGRTTAGLAHGLVRPEHGLAVPGAGRLLLVGRLWVVGDRQGRRRVELLLTAVRVHVGRGSVARFIFAVGTRWRRLRAGTGLRAEATAAWFTTFSRRTRSLCQS